MKKPVILLSLAMFVATALGVALAKETSPSKSETTKRPTATVGAPDRPGTMKAPNQFFTNEPSRLRTTKSGAAAKKEGLLMPAVQKNTGATKGAAKEKPAVKKPAAKIRDTDIGVTSNAKTTDKKGDAGVKKTGK